MDFNPNQPAKRKEFFWATYIPDRNPKFKMHANRGHALNAFQYRSNVILYRWDEQASKWDEIYRIEDRVPPEVCEHCNQTTMKANPYTQKSYNSGEFVWTDKKTDRPRQIWVHYDCGRKYRR